MLKSGYCVSIVESANPTFGAEHTKHLRFDQPLVAMISVERAVLSVSIHHDTSIRNGGHS